MNENADASSSSTSHRIVEHQPPASAADAWAKWAQDYGERPSNPKRGSWAALKHCFYGGMLAASAMLCKGPPQDLDTVRTRYFALRDELNSWIDQDETAASSKNAEHVSQDWMDDTYKWLHDHMVDPEIVGAIWGMMDKDEDGNHSLPEMGFAPQLVFAMAALDAIARCSFPRHDDPSGDESSVSLSTELRIIAAMTMQRLDGEHDEDSWQLPT